MHAGSVNAGPSRARPDVAEVDRAIRRLEATSSRWSPPQTPPVSPRTPDSPVPTPGSRRRPLSSRATQPDRSPWRVSSTSGHDATAEALDAGLVSPEHAAVIVRATGQLPDGVSAEQRHTVEASLVEKAARFSPDQLRRLARRAIEAVEPDQKIVDAHENELIRTEEQAAREKCSLTLHDNGDGTTTGHFTIPALAAAMLGKVIDAMTAPRRMRERSSTTARPFLRLAAPPRARVRRAPRAPPHRPPAPQDRGHRGRHHRPHRPGRRDESSPPRHRPGTLGRRSPAPRLHRRHPPRRPRQPSPWPSTSAARAGCSPNPNGWPKVSNTPPAPPPAANAPTPGASSTTDNPGPEAARTDLADAIPLCHQHHHGSTTPATTTRPCPTAASDSAGAREDRCATGYVQR